MIARAFLIAHPAIDIPPASAEEAVVPARASLVLLSLILVAAVANLNLAVANVALPDIGLHFGASQTQLDLVAVGYSLGLAASVLYLGALGDRYGRKLLLVLGVVLSIPACLLAAWAPTVEVLVLARIFGGLAAGMAFPTKPSHFPTGREMGDYLAAYAERFDLPVVSGTIVERIRRAQPGGSARPDHALPGVVLRRHWARTAAVPE